MTDQITYTILTSGEESIEKITRALKKKGFSIESSLESIGQIIGKGNEKKKKAALKIKGVKDIVATHGDINIGPPDADITW